MALWQTHPSSSTQYQSERSGGAAPENMNGESITMHIKQTPNVCVCVFLMHHNACVKTKTKESRHTCETTQHAC